MNNNSINLTKIPKSQALTNNKQFISDINLLRKAINNYCGAHPLAETAEYVFNIEALVLEIKRRYCISLDVLCSILRIHSRKLHRITGGALRSKVKRKPASYLVDRQHYARNILDGTLTVKDVVKLTGYSSSTIYSWCNDYKLFGNKMTNQAIAFRREI
jgi:predicted DNA-binding transcriptional regulator AlpA